MADRVGALDLTSDEVTALNKYTNFEYVPVNALLRGQCAKLSPGEIDTATELVKHIDSVFAKVAAASTATAASTGENGTAATTGERDRKYVYRGTSSRHVGLQKSYTSTSATDYIAWSHYGYDGTVMKIDITDVGWIHLEPYSTYNTMNSSNINENEILLDRDIQLKITKTMDKNDKENPYSFANARFIECVAVGADRTEVADKCKQVAGGKRKKVTGKTRPNPSKPRTRRNRHL